MMLYLRQMSENAQSTEQSSPSLARESDGMETTVQPENVQVEGQKEGPTKPTRKKKSPIWNFFEECQVPSKKKRGEMESKVKCKACGSLLTKNSSGTTSHFKRHLEQCDYYKLQQKSKQQMTINFRSTEEGDVDTETPYVAVPGYYDPTKIRELICKMIIVHELPFSIVEYMWFNALLKSLNPSYKKMSRVTIRNECMKLYESEKEVLKKGFKDIKKISLTCDLWTSNQTLCYMSLVAHYIDENWSMHCRVINFLELEPPHTGVVICNAISDCLAAWKIEDKIASITFDNASSNDLAAKLLLAKFTNRGALWFKGKFLHNPQKLASVQSALHELYALYESEYKKSMNNDSSSQCISTSAATSSSAFSTASQFQEFMKAQHATHPSKSDLMKYLDDPVEVVAVDKFDILQWWRMNELKCPAVARMAKDVLTIPISTVSSESAFSTGGRVIDDYRSSLLPSTVQALVCTSSWIRGGHHKPAHLEADANSIMLSSIETPNELSIVGSN